MNIGDIYDVNITKLSDSGQGIGKINDIVTFIDQACPGDLLRIKIKKINKNYLTAEIVDILEPSIHRVKPFCPMQKICGACQIQYIDYDYQLKIKQEIVQDAMDRIGHINVDVPLTIPSPENKNYRHKIQYAISQTKNSKRILAGYYKKLSHDVVNIKYCPIQPDICDEIIDFIRINAPKYNITGYDEKKHSNLLRHVLIRFSNKRKQCLVCLVLNINSVTENITGFCECLNSKFEQVTGVCINFNTKKTNVILGPKTMCLSGKEYIEEEICSKVFQIASDTFFQINPPSAENIFNYIKDFIHNNYNKPLLLDAYAGISAVGICLSDEVRQVVSIEENAKSVELARNTINLNKINNIEINQGDASKFFKEEKRKFDIIVLDPPRKGCSEESLKHSLRLCKGHIIYISCNPSTLARDLNFLQQNGAKIQSVQPFDMFCHSCHVENVAIIKV